LKKLAGILLVALVLGIITVGVGWGEIPQTISFQGYVTDSSTGQPVPVTAKAVPLSFKLYDDPTSKVSVGHTTNNSVDIYNGFFDTQLDISGIVLTNQHWVEVTYNGKTMTTRQPLLPVPYALSAEKINSYKDIFTYGNIFTSGKAGVGTNTAYNGRLEVKADQSYETAGYFESVGPIGVNAKSTKTDGVGLMSSGYIGLSASGTNLGVAGSGTYTGVSASSRVGFGISSDAPKNYFSGNVGIGTNAPSEKLDVAGNVIIGSSSSNANLDVRGSARIGGQAANVPSIQTWFYEGSINQSVSQVVTSISKLKVLLISAVAKKQLANTHYGWYPIPVVYDEYSGDITMTVGPYGGYTNYKAFLIYAK